ncbi:MAG: PucR family transcriptional regulator [Firmicutes bacterium]|nr:PucR family transcriptional regulator [Bacillota bacterium]
MILYNLATEIRQNVEEWSMITVHDVLSRPLFRSARIVAGSEGLSRPVHWVHVGEVPNLSRFLQGYELVLSTGVGLTNAELRLRFLNGLIQVGASALVLELGQYLPQVPDDMISLADGRGFPIIAFSDPIRFLEISQDINGLVISQHYRTMDDLELLSLKIRQALLNTEGAEKLVRLLYESIQRPVLYRLRDNVGQPIVYGTWKDIPPPFVNIAPHPLPERGPHALIRQTIMVFGRPIGDLMVGECHEELDERLYLALDRTAAALAQDFIRAQSLDRLRRQEDEALLEPLLFREEPEAYHCQRFRARYQLTLDRGYRVVIVEPSNARVITLFSKSISASFAVGEYHQTDRSIFVVSGALKSARLLKQTLRPVFHFPEDSILCFAGLSGVYQDPAQMHRALTEANDATAVARHLKEPFVSYEDMGIWRWILFTPHQDLQRLLIDPELSGLPCRPDASRLLDTLEVVLAHIDSKQTASEILGVHRQTLYSRIHTLYQLLGDDFLDPPRRLALESAVTAYRYLHHSPASGPLSHKS